MTLEPPLATDDEDRYEIVDGVRVPLPPMGSFQNRIAFLIACRFEDWGEELHGRGLMEILFRLPGIARSRRPDAAFLSYGKWPKQREIPEDEPWEMVPEVAVEVVSRSNSFQEIAVKIDEYFRAGVGQVWVVTPWDRKILAYRTPKEIAVFERGDTLAAEPLLPGFQLPLSDLFRAEVA